MLLIDSAIGVTRRRNHAPDGGTFAGAPADRFVLIVPYRERTNRSMEYLLAKPDAYPNVEVAGEAWREREITTAVGQNPRLDEEIEVSLPAVLVPEPDNPHDQNAISVRVRGQVVGYIERADTKKYLKDVQRVTASGHAPVVTARIWMVRRDHREDGTRFYSRISLTLPWEGGLNLPRNSPPAASYTLLPWGSGLQVTGEEAHFDRIKPYVTGADVDLVLVTLHRAQKLLKRGEARDIVEVRLDGERIGELTPTTSRHFLATIDHANSRGVDVAAYAHIKGSQLSAEVSIQGAKVTEIPDEWLNGAFVTLPALIPAAATYEVPPAYVSQPATLVVASKARSSKAGCLGVLAMLVVLGAAGSVLAGYLT